MVQKTKTLRDFLRKKVRKMYDDNFKLESIYDHYLIHPELQGDKEFSEYVLKEIYNNGAFEARAFYVRKMLDQIKKNKSLEDWQKFAKEFVEGFDKKGNVSLKKNG